MATYDLTSSIPNAVNIQTGDILNCPYSGNSVSITLPRGTFLLECWGAQGGCLLQDGTTGTTGGKGGYSTGILTLTQATILYLYVGGQGSGAAKNLASGGFNGGGSSYGSSASDPANGGGGGTDIRIGEDSLYARVIVAGGGGGVGEDNEAGGYGGGLTGGTGSSSSTTGGTQTSSGTGGVFGYGANTAYDGGAGGGGWYGGGTGGGSQTVPSSNNTSDAQGGCGGSGYVYTSATINNYPAGCLLSNEYYLGSASTVGGNTSFTDYDGTTVTGHSGNGAIRITAQSAYTQVSIPNLGDKTYNGSSQSPTETNYNSTYMTKSGDTSATLPGTYTITYTLKTTGSYIWSDGTLEPKDITWQITSNTWKEAQAWIYHT